MKNIFKKSPKTSNALVQPETATAVPFLVRHGDVLVQQVDALPASAKKRAGQVLVRGEATGHSHRVGESGAGVIYETADEMFLQITANFGTLVHEEHGPIELAQGYYRVWTQREYTPQRIVRVVD
jgi:antirestriction protein ArdC